MSVEMWQLFTGGFVLLSFLLYGEARFWKAKALTLDTERNEEGWWEEARFWRRHFDKDSAEWVEESR